MIILIIFLKLLAFNPIIIRLNRISGGLNYKRTINHKPLDIYIRNSKTIIPRTFFMNASIANRLPNCWLSRAIARRLL